MISSLPAQRRSSRRRTTDRYRRCARYTLLTSITLVVLASCTPADQRRASSQELASLGEQAASLSRGGEFGAARQIYLSMVRRAPPAMRQQYRILAAREAGREGRPRRALNELNSIEPRPEWVGLWSLAVAESERLVDGTEAAFDRLAEIDPDQFPDLADDLIRTRSRFLFALQRPAQALAELTRLGASFAATDAESAGFTWSLLRGYRNQLTTDGVEGVPLGWIELALLTDELEVDPTETRAALKDWQRRFPQHPATALLAETITGEVCEAHRQPSRIAMLLPGSERYASHRKSLRDGFLAARYALMASCPGPDVVFYEVAESRDAPVQWSRSAAEGAEIIVGPLLRESVEEVAGIAGARPTLALNRLRATPAPAGFEEFALSPEHETRQAARRAIRQGLTRALALYPATDWGRRVFGSFAEEFRAGGGEIIAREPYNPEAVDYSEQIGRLLKIGASNRRHDRLQTRLERRLDFEPRRRRDADLVFVVARSAQGQLLVPQLRYNYSGDLPVYAMQNIFDPGHLDNRDLNGVEMPALPLLADRHVQVLSGRLSPDRLAASGFNISLFAMGYDSFKLALALYNGPESLERGIRGLTGRIHRGGDGRLERELAWTRVVDGQLETPPASAR